MTEYRPANGSCPRCRGPLDMASLRDDGVWYCCAECADGEPVAQRQSAVPEARLYGVPRRFYRKRRPKELRSSAR